MAPDGFAFPNLKRVRGDVRVVLYSTMPMLSSLTFNNIFPVLEIVEGDLLFEGSGSSHDNVTTLGADTLPRLQKVFGRLKLMNMMRLTSLEGAFGNLTEVGGLRLYNLRRLPALGNRAFSNLTTVKSESAKDSAHLLPPLLRCCFAARDFDILLTPSRGLLGVRRHARDPRQPGPAVDGRRILERRNRWASLDQFEPRPSALGRSGFPGAGRCWPVLHRRRP